MRHVRIITATCIVALLAGCAASQQDGGLASSGANKAVDEPERNRSDGSPPPLPPPVASAPSTSQDARRASGTLNGRMVAQERYAGGFIRPVIVPTDPGRERYDGKEVSPVKIAQTDPVSTFSVDVDTGGVGAVAGSPAQCALFDLPRVPPERPSTAGLVAAVTGWDAEPAALIPLYLRRPDAKTLAERGLTR